MYDVCTGRAILWPVLFEEYVYNPEDRSDAEDEEEGPWTSFSIHLNTLLECLNIFGTASGSGTGFLPGPRPAWSRPEDSDNEGEKGDGRQQRNGNGRIDSFFPRASGKGTGMRLSYAGSGYPLVLLLYVHPYESQIPMYLIFSRAESSDGPTTTCELATYEPDDQLSLEIDSRNMSVSSLT